MARLRTVSLLLAAGGTGYRGSVAFAPPASTTRRPATATTTPTLTAAASPPSTTTALGMTKPAHRAFYERQLEELMDNDWRVFRARLVAQERAEAWMAGLRNGTTTSTTTGGGSSSSSSTDHPSDDRLRKQTVLTDFFAHVLGNFFRGHDKDKKEQQTASADHDRLFDGEFVGGAGRPAGASSPATSTTTGASALTGLLPPGLTEDPFLTLDELPLLLPQLRTVDRRRWAHPLPHVEVGAVLLANEKLGGVFHQTVVLITEHSEKHGSRGLVINRPMKGNLMKIASEQDTELDLSLKLAFPTAPVAYGGPLGTEQFAVLHGFGEVDGSRALCPGVYLGGSEALMDEVRAMTVDPRHALFVKGHAAWMPGQLDTELSKGLWYIASVSSRMILRHTDPRSRKQKDALRGGNLWSDVLQCMGDPYEQLALQHTRSTDRQRAAEIS